MSARENQQKVTGLVVNSRPNVDVDSYKRLRAMCHYLFTGKTPFEDRFYVDSKTDQVQTTKNHIEGRLNFIYEVDHRFDDRTLNEKHKARTARDKLYLNYIIYKTFFPSESPLVLTEGDTDRIYLVLSSLQLRQADPRFVDAAAVPPKISYRVLRRGKNLVKVAGLDGGTGNIRNALVNYRRFTKKYKVISQRYPVIILIDNDRGAKDLITTVKDNFGVAMDKANTEKFYKLHKGLYVV